MEMLEQSGGSSKVFGITKRELDFRYWLVFAIVPLSTSTREKDESTYASSHLKNHLSSGGVRRKMRHKGKNLLIWSGSKQRMKQNALFLSVRPDSKPDSNSARSSCADTPQHFFGSRRTLGALVALNGLGE